MGQGLSESPTVGGGGVGEGGGGKDFFSLYHQQWVGLGTEIRRKKYYAISSASAKRYLTHKAHRLRIPHSHHRQCSTFRTLLFGYYSCFCVSLNNCLSYCFFVHPQMGTGPTQWVDGGKYMICINKET